MSAEAEMTCGHIFAYGDSAPPLPADKVWCYRCGAYSDVCGTFEDRLEKLSKGKRRKSPTR